MLPFEIQKHTKDIDWPSWLQAGAAVFAAIGLVWNLILQRRYTRAQIKSTDLMEKSYRGQEESLKNQILINSRQTDLIQQQLQLNEIALKKHIRDIRPIFHITNEEKSECKLRLSYALAKNVSIHNIAEGTIATLVGAAHTRFFRDLHLPKGYVPSQTRIDFMKIDYEDEESRKYTQNITLSNSEFIISFPEKVE